MDTMDATCKSMNELEDDELMDKPVHQMDAVRGYEVDTDSDWYSRHYMFCHRPDIRYEGARQDQILLHGKP